MAQAIQYLTFGVDNERFAVPVEQVQEILDLRAVSRIPHAPDYVVGLMDVRGVGMLLIDLRAKFGLARVEATNRTRVIVADTLIEGTEVARRPGRRLRVRSDRSRRRRVRAAAGDRQPLAGGLHRRRRPPRLGLRHRPRSRTVAGKRRAADRVGGVERVGQHCICRQSPRTAERRPRTKCEAASLVDAIQSNIVGA